jgi:hypothetical protein
MQDCVRIGHTWVPKAPLKLYDPRLFALLSARHAPGASALLSLVNPDIFAQILAFCGPWQKRVWAQWTDKDALKEWLRKQDIDRVSLLVCGTSLKNPPANGPWHDAFTAQTLKFELLWSGRLVASGSLRWNNSVLFASDAIEADRIYMRLHFGKLGARADPRTPIRAHMGPSTMSQRFLVR